MRAVLVFLALGALLAGCDDDRTFAQKLHDGAPFACQTFIKGRLRDPDSAEFLTRDDDAKVSIDKDGNYSAVEVVRAANGFGGKTLTAFMCTMIPPSDPSGEWTLGTINSLNADTGGAD